MLLNCDVGEDSWESLRLQGNQTSQSWRKSVLNIHRQDWCWNGSSNTLATWCKEPTRWKRPQCWERLKAGGEGDDRGWVVGWHHQLNGHEFEQTLRDGEGQGSLACCSPWGLRVWHDWAAEHHHHCVINVSDRHVNTGGRQAIVRHSLASSPRNILLSNLIGLSFIWFFMVHRGKVAEVSERWELFTCCSGRKEGGNKCIKRQFHASPMLSAFTIVILPNSHENHMKQN